MKKILSILLILTIFIHAQTYQDYWSKIQELDKQHLPKSALKKVELIYQKATTESNEIETLKAIIKKTDYIKKLKEDGYKEAILFVENELKKPYQNSTKAILKSILARLYDEYQQFRYYQSNRSSIKDNNSTDMETWSRDMFRKKVDSLYWDSLSEETKYISLKKYKDILTQAKNTKGLRTTLYDILAFRALSNFNSDYTFSDEALFGDISTFINYPLYDMDKTSDKYRSLYIYQSLLRLHQENGDTKALNSINLDRLNFINEHFNPINTSSYIEALKRIKDNNKEALYYLAYTYQNIKDYDNALKYANRCVETKDRYIVPMCQDIINSITFQNIEVNIEDINLPNENILSKISYRNIDKLYIKVIKLTQKEEDEFLSLMRDKDKYVSSLKAFKSFDIDLPKSYDYKRHSTEVSLGSYDMGSYIFVFSKSSDFSDKTFYQRVPISKIAYLYRDSKLIVVDRLSGKPLEGVDVWFYWRFVDRTNYRFKKRLLSKEVSNRDGFVSMPNNKVVDMVLQKGNDRVIFDSRVSSRENHKVHWQRDSVSFFTDRAIYRPSQTIYFKGIAIQKSNYKAPKVLANKRVVVSLFNTNNQKVETKEFTTDEFGSFYGSFTAPKSGRMGRMYISSSKIKGRKYIRVEEYKRAKFEVNFKPIKDEFSLGDRVSIIGEAKAFSGYGLANSKVHYEIKRLVSFPWLGWYDKRPNFPAYPTTIDSGDIKSDKDGKFTIEFDTKFKDLAWLDKYKPLIIYEVTARVTSPTGETQESSKSIKIGYVSIEAKIKIADEVNIRDDINLTLITTNLNGVFKPTVGTIDIQKFILPQKSFRKRYWTTNDIDKPLYSREEFERLFQNYRYYKDINQEKKVDIKRVPFDTGKSKIVNLNGLKEGTYLLTLTLRDKNGIEVKKSKQITIYDLDSPNIPTKYDFWHKLDKKQYKPNSSAKIVFKSRDKRYILLGLERDGKIKEEWIKADKVAKKIVEIGKKDLGNIVYQIATIKNNRVRIINGVIPIPWSEKLKIEFLTFREKLKPNSKERWRIKISGENKEKVLAQMVATMYDASLDKLVPSNFTPPSNLFPYNNSIIHKLYKAYFYQTTKYYSWSKRLMPVIQREFYDIKYFDVAQGGGRGGDIGGVNGFESDTLAPMPMPVVESAVNIEPPSAINRSSVVEPYNCSAKIPKAKKSGGAIHIRKNLKETMFFKPNLQTDKDGNIIIEFKTNDNLTKWNFLAFAHNKKVQNGMIKKEVITQKELMVSSNLPRFFREGDKIEIVESIVNLSSRDLEGECELKLKNPIDGRDIYGTHKFIKRFKLKKGESKTFSFYIKIPSVDKVQAIEHTFIAKTKTHTDAEQVVKPILSNREFITESKSLWLKGNESKKFTLKSLKENNSPTIKNYRLTLEFTSNPIWYAIKSMPYLMKYPHECNEQLFSRFFSNAISSKILNSKPKIKKVFDSWRDRDELKSQLNLNQELKSAMIEDTPWLIEAQNEEQQQKNMALLFDLDKMAKEKKEALSKLFERQNRDGGWAWFSGGYSNWYITQYILEGFYRLKKLGIDIDDYSSNIDKAIEFIDTALLKEYNYLKEESQKGVIKLSKNHLSSLIIQYLYVREMYPKALSKELQEAFDYYISQAKEYALIKRII